MRIVSLSPSFTEILQSLGLHENLVGITSECPTGLSNPARVGGPKTLQISEIQKLSPDLILTERKENRPEEIREIEKNFKVVSYNVVSLPLLIQAISELGELVKAEDAAKELIRKIYQEWPAPPKDPVRTAILIWNNPMLTVSSRSYISNLVEAAGGWNLYREDPLPEVAIELEEMLDQAPELFLLPSMPYAFDAKQLGYYKNLPSLANKKVELVDGTLFSRFGPQTVIALKKLKTIVNSVRSFHAG